MPLVFGRALAEVTLSENGVVATKMPSLAGGGWRTASSTVVMRSGLHFAQFTVGQGNVMLFGVVPPDWNVEGGRTRTLWTATASNPRATGGACPATPNGRRSNT